MESIYDQMNKIDDTESLNEKYNVRTLKDVKKLQEAEAPKSDRSSIKTRVNELIGMVDWSKWKKFTSTGDDTKPEVKKTKAIEGGIRVDVYLGWDYGHKDDIEEYVKAVNEKFEAFAAIVRKQEPSWSVKLVKSHGSRGVTWTNYWAQVTAKNSMTEGANEASITISDVRQLLHKQKEELPYGFLTVTSDAVRYFTEEMDGVHYSKITELLTVLQNDPAAFEEAIEDPMCLIDYFTESHFMSHADEVEFFAEKVRELNLKYFGTEKVDEIDDEFDAACASTMELFDENYNVKTLKGVKKLRESVDTDNNMRKLQNAATSVKCKLTPGFIEYATEDPEMLDDAIEDELLYCGKVLCAEFPEMTSWEFGEDEELTDKYGSYCVVETGTDEGRILVQVDGHGRIYNLE